MCCIDHANKVLFRSANAIFGKVGRTASEEVTLELACWGQNAFLCWSIGLECFSLP